MTRISATKKLKLTRKQEVFVDEYVICRNGAEAARRAKYKERSARQIAAENMTKPVIIEAITAKEAQMVEKLELDRNAVIGGIFTGIAQARILGDPGNIIRGWVEVSKIMGFDKPETAKSKALSPSNQVIEAKLAQLSDAELYALAEGRTTL